MSISKFYDAASRAPNYIKRFGSFYGLLLFGKIESRKYSQSKAICSYKVPGYTAPIYLRKSIADHSIFWQCIVQAQYRFQDFPQSKALFQHYNYSVKSKKELLIIDCGANIGLSVIWFAETFPKAKIFAVEPDDENYKLLKKNTSHLGERVVCFKGAVWNKPLNLEIMNPDSGSASFRMGEVSDDSYRGVSAYTIDNICELAEVDQPFIVKLDIEGSQKNLFKNNNQWVSKTQLIILELDDWLLPWQGTSRTFFSCVSQFPFDYLLGGENIFCFRDRND
jgi:FkbM family methyltransferase